MAYESTKERITTAGVLIVSGRYFVAQRRQGGAIGGLWEFPGGKHRWGGTPAQSLAREFIEEFGLSVHVGQCFHKHDFIHRDTLFHLHAFWVETKDPVRLSLHEHQQVRWVSLNDLMALEFVPSDIPVREAVYKYSFA